MATIYVPDALVGEIEAALELARRTRIAQIDKEMLALERERAALVSQTGHPPSPRTGRKRLTDDDVLRAIRAGATNATQLAATLNVSIPTVRAKLKTLVEQGHVRTDGERRSRRLSAL